MTHVAILVYLIKSTLSASLAWFQDDLVLVIFELFLIRIILFNQDRASVWILLAFNDDWVLPRAQRHLFFFIFFLIIVVWFFLGFIFTDHASRGLERRNHLRLVIFDLKVPWLFKKLCLNLDFFVMASLARLGVLTVLSLRGIIRPFTELLILSLWLPIVLNRSFSLHGLKPRLYRINCINYKTLFNVNAFDRELILFCIIVSTSDQALIPFIWAINLLFEIDICRMSLHRLNHLLCRTLFAIWVLELMQVMRRLKWCVHIDLISRFLLHSSDLRYSLFIIKRRRAFEMFETIWPHTPLQSLFEFWLTTTLNVNGIWFFFR